MRPNGPKPPDYDEAIKQHYDHVAQTDKDSATSTMADLYIREKETTFISGQIAEYTRQQKVEHLDNGGYARGPGKDNHFSILDVGCGNGYTLARIIREAAEEWFAGSEIAAKMLAAA
jgi:ubiquinone/menaquinone biosynthesis C-methylase UbiE